MRERLKRFSLGMLGMEREGWCCSGRVADVGMGGAARVIMDADSTSKRSPIL